MIASQILVKVFEMNSV